MFQPTPSPLYASYNIYNSNSPSHQDSIVASSSLSFDYRQEDLAVHNHNLRHDGSGGPSLLADSIFDVGAVGSGSVSDSSPAAHSPFTSTNTATSTHQLNFSRTRNGIMADLNDHDFEAQQQAASQYEPGLQGPLVGEKKSSHAITQEYARADPVYVEKTRALAQEYSHYRPILGDGNCGWRAIAFSYFELLQKMGNKNQIEAEVARMQNMRSIIISTLKMDPMIFESMQEEAVELLQDISNTLHHGPFNDSNSVILQRFNDRSVSESIVYWFRIMACSVFVMDSMNYEPFLPDGMSPDQYREDVLMPSYAEIDHLGMTLLIAAVLTPIGAVTAVVYLDRSPGSQVNTHFLPETDHNGNPTNPDMFLLYRPGHYDILYKDGFQLQAEIPQMPIQVHRVHSIGQHHGVSNPMHYDSSDFDFNPLTEIPGMSMLFAPHSSGFSALDNFVPPTTYGMPPNSAYEISSPSTIRNSHSPSSPLGDLTFPSQALPIHSMPEAHSPISPHPIATSAQNHIMLPPTSPTLPMHQTGSNHGLPSQHSHPSIASSIPHQGSFSMSQQPQLQHSNSYHTSHDIRPPSRSHAITSLPPPQTDSPGNIIRISKHMVEPQFAQPLPPPQTSPFRESNYNSAHFRNDMFQPEQWTPADGGGGGGGSSHRRAGTGSEGKRGGSGADKEGEKSARSRGAASKAGSGKAGARRRSD